MITCTRRIQFCAGHRVYGHEGKCRNIHGHNYVALFTAQAEALDGIGRVIDFSVLKERLGGWIEENWDHGFIYWEDDPEMVSLFILSRIPTDFGEAITKRSSPNGEFKAYCLPENPTAENMAVYLLHEIAPTMLEGTGIWLNKVQLWETENCYATAEL